MIGRVQDLVPEVYVNESRDFLLLGRVYDCLIQGVKFDIDTMKYLTNTQRCNDRVLLLLLTKVGFFSDMNVDNVNLRYILKAFPYLIRNKGSKKAIELAVYIFLKISNVKSTIKIYEDTVLVNGQFLRTYSLRIGIEEKVKDILILDEMLKYVLPTGYSVSYFYYTKGEDNPTNEFTYKDSVLLCSISNSANSVLKDSDILSPEVDNTKFARAIGTTLIYNNDSINPTFSTISTTDTEIVQEGD